MMTILDNYKGKSSTPFIVLCTMLFCLSVFSIFQFSAERTNRNRVEQAEFEQAYGKAAGSAANYKELEAEIQNQRKLETEKQVKLKEEWLARLDAALQAGDHLQLGQTVSNLKQPPISQTYAIQALQEVLSRAVLEYNDSAAVVVMVESGAPLVDCKSFRQPGENILKQALSDKNVGAFETLVKAGCIAGNTSALIARIVTAAEPERGNLFKALNSNSTLQISVIKSMLEEDQQQVVIDYIDWGLISKDALVGSTSILGYSIEHKKFLLRDYLVGVEASAKGGSSVYDHALIKALKLQDTVLVNQLVALFSEDLDDSKLVAAAFSAAGDDIKHEVTRALINSNSSVIQNVVEIRKLLRRAVWITSDYRQVEFLLEKGADPNMFIGRQTLLSAALEKTPSAPPEMIDLLRAHGALEDPLEVVRQKRGIDKNTECSIADDNPVNQAFFTAGFEQMNKTGQAEKIAEFSNVELCEAGVYYCKEQGNGVDACMASISSCSTTTSGLCCDAEIKEAYFEGRCAGLGVTEAIMLIDVFSSAYGVPVSFQ